MSNDDSFNVICLDYQRRLEMAFARSNFEIGGPFDEAATIMAELNERIRKLEERK